MDQSLFERLGGDAAIDAAVELFYEKVLTDDRIKHYFESVEMNRMRNHQKRFLAYAFGGRPAYAGRTLRAAHMHLPGLADSHFDAVKENLAATLVELGVAPDLVDEAAAIVEATRSDILSGGN